jgi:hypothetical protein
MLSADPAQHERLRRIASGARAQQAHPDLQRQEHRLFGVPHLQPFVERREAGPRCPPHQSRSSRRRRYPRAASRRHARSGPSECALAATRARLTGDRCRCSMPAYDLDRSTAGTPCGTVGVRSSRRGPRRLPRAPRGRQRSASTFPPWNLHPPVVSAGEPVISLCLPLDSSPRGFRKCLVELLLYLIRVAGG